MTELHTQTEWEATSAQAAGPVAGSAELLVPQRERGMEEAVLPADYPQIMDGRRLLRLSATRSVTVSSSSSSRTAWSY